jgi:hypothetical protein
MSCRGTGAPVVALAIAAMLVLTTIALPASAVTAEAASEADPITEVRLSVDVTGDGQIDVIELIARPYEPGSAFASSRVVRLTDGATAHISVLDLGEAGAGLGGRLWTANIDNSGVPTIFVAVATGGSGGVIVPFVLTAAGSGDLMHVPTMGQLASSPK